MNTQIDRNFFRGRRFSFSRIDKSLIASKIALDEDGTIAGHSHYNEASWTIEADNLVFLDSDSAISTIFDRVELTDEGWIFLGKFLKGDSQLYWHKLVELPSNFSPAPCIKAEIADDRPANSVAVFVRSHKLDEKFDDLMSKLERSRVKYDLFPIIDESRGRAKEVSGAVWHSVAACQELGLTQSYPLLLWRCGDFPLYFALRERPGYSHYIMIEDDVDLTRSDGSFFGDLCTRLEEPRFSGVDHIGLQMRWDPPGASWQKACGKVLPGRYCYYTSFQFVGLSQRAASYLFSQRQIEALRDPFPDDVIHCEAFVPSFLIAAGFRSLDLNEIMPGCYASATIAMQVGDRGLGKPMGYPLDVEKGIEMIHPIYTPEEFLERAYRKFATERKGDWTGLRELLSSDVVAGIPKALIDNTVAKIPADLSAELDCQQ